MARSAKLAGPAQYYQALQKTFQLESEILTSVLPHLGERGRNDEERFRRFLERVLPKKFSVGTGFVVCSEPDIAISNQADIVLFDEIHNSPLHRELSAMVFPVEMVYGTIEVKGRLAKKDLKSICTSIKKIRKAGEHRWYLEYTSQAKSAADPNKRVVAKAEHKETVPPRAFVLAYDKKGWKTIDDLVLSLKEATREHGAHIHGLAVLSCNWYVAQEAHASGGPKFMASEGDALLKFMRGLLHSVASLRVRQASMDRYFDRADA
jgi:hypothetical protein